MSAPATSFHAAFAAFLYLFLTWRIIAQRRAKRIDMGAGGDRLLERYVRSHANFAEYTPVTLILLILIELQGWPAWLIHLLGSALLAGRAAHAWSFSAVELRMRSRVLGMTLTIGVLALSGVLLLAGLGVGG
jgi:uncharacterized membrane protein YecN with MAPEG domain